jgi:hypothetical protein
MKALMTYGTVNEDTKHISSYNIEYKAKAADGKYYGIIRENSKYFVKVATPGKEMIAEAYQYIGGVQNKKDYEYNSYANALKQFELKLGSINEAYDENRRVNVEALDPYKKEDLVIEGTEKMKNELARQRQIMRNACVIMNEATEIGSTPFKSQPESEHDNSGDKDYPFTKEGKPEADRGAIKFDGGDPEKHSATFGPDSNDVEDYDLDKGKTPKVKDSVASETPKGGKVARVDESMGESCGSCGMAECGTGPFNEEGEEDLELGQEEQPVDTDELDSVAPEELGDEELDGEEDELGDEEDLDAEEPEFGEEDELGDEEDLDDDEFDFEDDDDLGEEDELGDDEDELGDDEDLDLGDEEDGEFEEEPEEGDFEGDEDFEDEDELGDDEEEDPEIELDENVVKKFRKLVRESINEMFGDDFKSSVAKPYGMSDEEYFSADDDDEEDDFDDEDDEFNPDMADDYNDFNNGESAIKSLREAKTAKMNSIVESVVNDILNEDELHVFGDHPGYRKKPMTLPQTGEDKNQWGRDWNDESVHSEEPFGKGKGDSTPFDQLVAQITDSVMKQINENKKKVK